MVFKSNVEEKIKFGQWPPKIHDKLCYKNWAHCKMTQNPNDKWQALSGSRFVIDTANEQSIALNVKNSLYSERKIQKSNWEKWKMPINRKDNINNYQTYESLLSLTENLKIQKTRS